ncbi:MAG TPA: hypothetical protein PLL30_14370 [Candidatus Krumholzibacteria bacterium]|nr:hypothetical protein [Candidatus Krumholzibacteria bacterium]HPD72952.1 hypothetical protein [Candidatus Krumholzibacteria bacterium]HRY41751.1 hypothetical protein [Candidatus Krumholzibacteria bacterium]
MRAAFLILALVLFALAALAHDLGPTRPARPAPNVAPPPEPGSLRQGGDTIFDATPLDLGYTEINGTTTPFTNDYDEVCPYTGSVAPDVVYTFIPAWSSEVTVDMWGSSFDTKIYIYDQDLALVACNDDYYSDYTSRLDCIGLNAGVQYFLIIDGYGAASGTYTGYVYEATCGYPLECPAGSQLENEPPLVDGYLDSWNGGCNSPEFGEPFQTITASSFCGKGGYFLSANGEPSRDTDWFHILIPAYGYLEVTGDAEEPSYMFELGPQQCGIVDILQMVEIGYGPGTMTIDGPVGSLVWFWVGSQTFWDGDTYEYDYVLWLNLAVPAQTRSWTAVKQLFD